MGSSRAWPLLLLLLLLLLAAAAAAAAHADAHAAQERANGDASGARDAAALATGDITADDVRAAWEAWNKLRDATTNHTVRKRAASLPEQPEQPEQPDPPAAAAAADPKRVRVAEFTLSAESSFTAVSRALNRLADRSRSPAGAPIAATEFVVEGSVDADTIQSYLRSHAARGSLAAAEADALRKVVGMLLQAPGHAPAKAPAASTAAPRQRAKRAAPRLFQPQVGQPYESPPTATSSPASPAPPPPEGVLSGRFVWALADDSFDAARPAEGIRRRMPPLYLAPIVPRVLRGGDDDDDSDDSGGGEDLARAKSSGDLDNQEDEEQDDDDDEADEFIEVEDDRGSELEGGGIANRRLSDEGDFELYDEDERDNIASAKSDIF